MYWLKPKQLRTNITLGTEKLDPSPSRYTNNPTGTKLRADHYWSTLFRLALSRAIDEGRIITLLPEDIPQDALTRFQQGGVWDSQDVPEVEAQDNEWTDSQLYVANRLAHFLASSSKACILCEDYIHDPVTDPPAGVRFISYRSEVYLLLQHQESADVDAILDILYRKASMHDRRCLLTHCDISATVQSVSLEFLESAAAKVSHVLVGAYDEDSELIWSRAGLNF